MADAQQPSTALTSPKKVNMITKFAEQYDISADKVFAIVGATVFKGGKDEPPLTAEETVAALIVCNAYELNPFTKEIYAFRSKGKLLIVVGVDGWARIVTRQPQLNGIEFDMHFTKIVDAKTGEVQDGPIIAVTCKIHRKDCALPIVVTEYTHECRRDSIPWNTMPIRMTRNRAFVQCARIAFSLSGIVDDDEAQTIEGSPEFATSPARAIIDQSSSRTDAVKNVVRNRAQKASQTQEPSATNPTQTTATTQSTVPPTNDGQQAGTPAKSDPSPETGTVDNPDAEPADDLFTQQTAKPGPVAVEKQQPKAAPPPIDEGGW